MFAGRSWLLPGAGGTRHRRRSGSADDHLFPYEEPEWSPFELHDGRVAEGDGGMVLTGSVRIHEDGHLVLDTNSSRRADDLITLLLEAIDGAEVIDDVRTPIGDLLAQASDGLGVELELGEELPSGGLDLGPR